MTSSSTTSPSPGRSHQRCGAFAAIIVVFRFGDVFINANHKIITVLTPQPMIVALFFLLTPVVVATICCNLPLFATIRHHPPSFATNRRHSPVTRGHSPSPAIIRHHPLPFAIIRRHSPSPAIIRHHPPSFAIIRRHSPSPVLIRCHPS